MKKRVTASIQLADGPELTIIYDYIVLNDGGDPHLVAWEPADGDDDRCDMVLNEAVLSSYDAEKRVRSEAHNALSLLIRSNMTTRCFNCD